jgi:hypothetical protein
MGRIKARSDGAGVGTMPAPAFGLDPAYDWSLAPLPT